MSEWANFKCHMGIRRKPVFFFEEYKDMYVYVCKFIYLFTFILFKGYIPFNIYLTYHRPTTV